MNLLAQSALLAVVIAGVLGVLHLQRRAAGPLNAPFAILCGALFLHYCLTFVTESFDVGASWDIAAAVAGLFVAPIALAFFRRFLEDRPRPGVDVLVRLAAVVLAGLAFTALGRTPLVRAAQWVFSFGVLYACALLVRRRLAAEDRRIHATRLRYLLVGHLVAVTFTALDFLPSVGVPFLTIGNAVTGLYLYLLSQALLRHRLLDVQEVMGKGVVLGLLAVVLATIYTLLVVWVGDNPALMVFNSLVASIVILVLFDPLRLLAERRVAPLLFRQKFEFERRLDALRRELAGIVEVPAMGRRLVRRLELSRRVTHASLYLMGPEGATYGLLAHAGPEPPAELPMPASRPLLELVDREGAVVLEDLHARILEARRREAVGGHSAVAELEAVAGVMDVLRAGVVIPLRGREGLLGLLCLQDDRIYEAYSYDEIRRMVEVARQAALCVENSRLYEGLRERDRLAVLGEMAAGLAHEVRNPLGAIKGAAQVLQSAPDADRRAPEPMLDVIVEEVDRLNVVVGRFLDYARPMNVEPAPTDVSDLVRRTATALRASPEAEGIDVEVDVDADLPAAMADEEMLKTVLVNLGRNALEATPLGGRVTLATGRRGDLVEIRVTDTGRGMDQEALGRLFVPFYTTKDKGTGLGLAISHRVVARLGGAIDVRSRPGEGSTFLVKLPLAPVE